MADKRIGLDTEEQRRRYHKAQLGELEKFAGAALRDIQAAESRGEARGRAAVLAEVAKLPSPIRHYHSAEQMRPSECFCVWCDVRWPFTRVAKTFELTPHPDNGCLWVMARAHAAGVAAPEER